MKNNRRAETFEGNLYKGGENYILQTHDRLVDLGVFVYNAVSEFDGKKVKLSIDVTIEEIEE